ncbi:hypothetical protein ACJRO7_015646 [Eucalyptus globulus]|uniref:Uncharacterized protein n=1 Tax=Eucalyptus globulus TaxID=34317 RepID=A0ABD3LA81_EUCGL
MVPNIDLILVALLYGTLVAGILIAVVVVVLAGLVLGFAAGLFSIIAMDSCIVFQLLSWRFDLVKADVELGLLLLLCTVLRCGVSASSALRPWAERGVRASVEAARRARILLS